MPKVIDETKIYAAAIHIFMSLGYDGATTKEIADIAGVNEVTLFRKFGSKAGLFEKAIAHQLADTPLHRLDYTGDLEADLLAIVDAYVETNETYGDIIAIILIELPRNPDLKGVIDTPWQNLQVILKIIQQYQTQGLLKNEPVLATISALIGPIMVHQMFRRANLNLPVPTIDPQTHVASFLHGRKP
ncbi:MAG: TetR/AcrR family transcriptional regulator [Caldilineaceae bacterium]